MNVEAAAKAEAARAEEEYAAEGEKARQADNQVQDLARPWQSKSGYPMLKIWTNAHPQAS